MVYNKAHWLRPEFRPLLEVPQTSFRGMSEMSETRVTEKNLELDRDVEYMYAKHIHLKTSNYSVCDGSVKYGLVLNFLLRRNGIVGDENGTVTTVRGPSGTGKTETCLLALKHPQVRERYPDGLFAIELGRDEKESYIIEQLAEFIRSCNGFRTARRVEASLSLRDAASKAQIFFSERRILVFLDNVWEQEQFHHLRAIVACSGSGLLITTRSTRVSSCYEGEDVELGPLNLEKFEDLAAAKSIFIRRLGKQKENSRVTNFILDEALRLSEGLPLAIASIASLVRERLETGSTNDLLYGIDEPIIDSSSSNEATVCHQGLLTAVSESLRFLDNQKSSSEVVILNAPGIMTKRYAFLCVLNYAQNRISRHVLAMLWNISEEEADNTATAFYGIGLATYTERGSQFPTCPGTFSSVSTLHLLELQRKCSEQLCSAGRDEFCVEDAHEAMLHGVLKDAAKVDAPATAYIENCSTLYHNSKSSGYVAGSYVVSNLVGHLIGSITQKNVVERWATICRLLSDARWLFLWERVEGKSFVCQAYMNLGRELSKKATLFKKWPGAQLEALAEIGRAVRIVPPKGPLTVEEKQESAAAEIFRRLHATWRERPVDLATQILRSALLSLLQIASWWMLLPIAACHDPPVRDSRLLSSFATSTSAVVGCSLVGGGQHLITACRDGKVRLHDRLGTEILSRPVPFDNIVGICAGTTRDRFEYHIFCISEDDRRVMHWRISRAPDAVNGVLDFPPRTVWKSKDKLRAIACNADASIVAAGATTGSVYAWGNNRERSSNESYVSARLSGHQAAVTVVVVSSDGSKMLSGSEGGKCHAWDLKHALTSGGSNKSIMRIPACGLAWPHEVRGCAFADSDQVAVIAYSRGILRTWRLATKAMTSEIDISSPCIASLVSAGGSSQDVVVGSNNGSVHVVNVSGNGSVTARLRRIDNDAVCALSILPNDKRTLACGHLKGQVTLWDFHRALDSETSYGADRKPPPRPRHSRDVPCVSSSPCGRVVASGSTDGYVCKWDSYTGEIAWMCHVWSPVLCVCVTADASHIACGCFDGTVHVLDGRDHACVHKWAFSKPAMCVALFNLSDGLVWSIHRDGELVAWRPDCAFPFKTIENVHRGSVKALAVKSGSHVVCSQDATGQVVETTLTESGGLTVQRDQYRKTSDEYAPADEEFSSRTMEYRRCFAGPESRHVSAYCTLTSGRFKITIKARPQSRSLDVKLESNIAGREHISCTATFDERLQSFDVAFEANSDTAPAFAMIACGFFDGTVCIFRQPLNDRAQQWNIMRLQLESPQPFLAAESSTQED